MSAFKLASAASELLDSGEALQECLQALRLELGAARPQALFLFASPHHRDSYARIQEALLEELQPGVLLGCTGGGIIGGARELEHSPGLSLTAACLPGARLEARHLGEDQLPGPDAPPKAWEQALGVSAAERPAFIVLLSPFMARPEDLLAGLDYAFPAAPKAGGVVSGLRHVGERALFLDGQRFHGGALVLALRGPLRLRTLVAQGCRPVGPLYTVTRCRSNWLEALDGRSSLRTLQDVFSSADRRTRDLMQRALFVGLAGSGLGAAEPAEGDFLVRNVMGLDGREGGMAVGAELREGMRLRFHVRDGESAAQELGLLLERARAEEAPGSVAGGLLFSCLGRGERLFGQPDHDSRAFAQAFGTQALGGFFCNGEIGPVAGSTHLHSFTSSYAYFCRDVGAA